MGGVLEQLDGWLQDSHFPVVQDAFHDAVNEGRAFGNGHIWTGTASNAQQNVLINGMGATKECVAQWIIAGGADLHFFIYEDPTVLTTGTMMGGINFNRTLGNAPASLAPQWLLSRGAGVSSIGTLIRQRFIPGGGAGQTQGGFIEFPFKFVFAPGHRYWISLLNAGNGAETMSLLFDWFERNKP